MTIVQYKPKLLQYLLPLLILLTAFTIPVHAMEGNGDGKDDIKDLTEHKNGGYPSYAKTGWLVYLVNTSGSLCSEVAYVSSSSDMTALSYNATYLLSRIGETHPSSVYANAEWGTPFEENGASRGAFIKDELTTGTNYGGEDSNAYYVVKKYLGEEPLALFKEQPDTHYLVLETVAWHKIFTGSAAGTYAVASSSGWAKLQLATGIVPEGDGHTGWCDNKRLQISCHVSNNWEGLPLVPSKLGRVSSSEVIAEGYGLLAIRGKEGDSIHTYWSPNGSPCNPEPAPPNKIGRYNIVKGYYEENITTGEKTSLGVYETEQCIPSISVDDEPNFELVDTSLIV